MVTQCLLCALLAMWDQYLALGAPSCLEGMLFALTQFGECDWGPVVPAKSPRERHNPAVPRPMRGEIADPLTDGRGAGSQTMHFRENVCFLKNYNPEPSLLW